MLQMRTGLSSRMPNSKVLNSRRRRNLSAKALTIYAHRVGVECAAVLIVKQVRVGGMVAIFRNQMGEIHSLRIGDIANSERRGGMLTLSSGALRSKGDWAVVPLSVRILYTHRAHPLT